MDPKRSRFSIGLILVSLLFCFGCVEVFNDLDSQSTSGPTPVIAPADLPPPSSPPADTAYLYVFEVFTGSGFVRVDPLVMPLPGGQVTVRLSVFTFNDGIQGAEVTDVGQITVSVRDESVATHKESDGRNLTFVPKAPGTTFATVSTEVGGAVEFGLEVPE